MRPSTHLCFYLAATTTCHANPTKAHQRHCKESYTSPGWPSKQTWNDLNTTLSGSLLSPLPPAAVCDPTLPNYNTSLCAKVADAWHSPAYFNKDATSAHQPFWQNDACVPPQLFGGNGTCDLRPFSKYVVNATEVEHVVEGIKFAREKNLRVGIKNTGHDFLGRSSTGTPDFSIYTYGFKNISILDDFLPESCSKKKFDAVKAVKAGSGVIFSELYKVADEHDFVCSGGIEPSVGLGGWLTSGGHGPVGAIVGLGVDNVLEMEVVLPSGKLVTANECHNEELFWAMRGAGSSTFGVMISATLKTYPMFETNTFSLAFQSIDGSEESRGAFFSLLADLFGELISWSDNYINGYITFGPTASAHEVSADESLEGSGYSTVVVDGGPMSFNFGGFGHNRSKESLDEILAPFVARLNTTEGVNGSYSSVHLDRVADIMGSVVIQSGYNYVLTNRLWSQKELLDKKGLIKTFEKLSGIGVGATFVSGPALRDHRKISTTSVSPSWRDSYAILSKSLMHNYLLSVLADFDSATGQQWNPRNFTRQAEILNSNTNVFGKAIRDHSPGKGAYLNEADPYDPGYPEVFWGEHYQRLLKLKHRLDPEGMFWCRPCIGGEEWEVEESTGRICRV
ncbi:hypothetical protein AC578_10248 [Pseudocercospora eumusae]|uniref:FAD-binding PCMH-type domain-containing protein n=1 Tax=Pseudocercospora eumusae TaxID=321146 RepID=A0A139HYU7_9PEZI|nr:hypothetical protein AC578_10248 [Pseudocercospora eumusae]